MIISIIGMSGVGKSVWAKMLSEDRGFIKYCCDDLIEEKLQLKSDKLKHKETNRVSLWMGQPYDSQYRKNSQKYLQLEGEVMRDMLKRIQNSSAQENIVIDTTGSVVHLPKNILNDLKKFTRIVYLQTPKSIIGEMIKRYLNHPKPVVWGDFFKPLKNEGNKQAMERCYPNLLRYREKKYEKLADVTIDYYKQIDKNFKTKNFLRLLSY